MGASSELTSRDVNLSYRVLHVFINIIGAQKCALDTCICSHKTFCIHMSLVPDMHWLLLEEWSSTESTCNHLFISASPTFVMMEVQGFLQVIAPRCARLGTQPSLHAVPVHIVWHSPLYMLFQCM
ncbi:hypothetical protein RRG08_046005 [Elysia crispata]|uniref:Uncharacterized protein n=1 Tax=Elysia crispata TaxID=231223 RepID=A0AAE1DEP6_9GAST|nr:hypothetical protein RRG08_046005 [Elysia crispata]